MNGLQIVIEYALCVDAQDLNTPFLLRWPLVNASDANAIEESIYTMKAKGVCYSLLLITAHYYSLVAS